MQIRACVFDAYGTLFDVAAAAPAYFLTPQHELSSEQTLRCAVFSPCIRIHRQKGCHVQIKNRWKYGC